jgi:hypothetical protein
MHDHRLANNMHQSPDRRSIGWVFRGTGYGIVLGAAAASWLPFRVLFFAGILVTLLGSYWLYRANLLESADPSCPT